MTTTAKLPSLTDQFPPSDHEGWLALVNKALKGADFDRRLKSRTADNIVVDPIYGRRGNARVISRADAAKPWTVTVRADHPVAGEAAAMNLADLEGGADGLALVFAGSPTARGFGLSAETEVELDACLAGVMLDLVALRIEPHPAGAAVADRVAALVARRRHDAAALDLTFGLDPIGVLASTGALPATWTVTGQQLARSIESLRGRGFKGPFVTCDIRPYSEAGASEAQELAAALATGVAYVRALESAGMAVADAFRCLTWTFAVDADQFLGIAKLRAMRLLWARIAAASGAGAAPITIHAETAWRYLTKRDPGVNMLRATAAAFAAGVGGADSLTVLPHTSALGLPDALARRIARNTQLVLQEETNLWRVADPSAGAGAIEALTERLCDAGWRLFQEIERDGGMVESLCGAKFQDRIAAVAATRAKDIASRKAPITGTSEFPNLTDVAGGIAAIEPRAAPLENVAEGPLARRLPSRRFAEPFEALRDAADRMANRGQRPAVFLANLGPLAEHGARATWIANLLAAGGIAVIGSDGFARSQDAGAAFAASGSPIACLCGTDDAYALLGEAGAQALKGAGASHVLVAGKPGDRETALKAAGVDQFLFAGQDVLAALREIHRAFGMTAPTAHS